MINGIGVVGWGVGGIEAEAGMLGQPVYFLTPDVVGVAADGHAATKASPRPTSCCTVTEMLRKAKVVGKFVEFFGEGAASLPVPDRATIANMAPEYGATMGFFPVDEATVDYLRATGRTDDEIDAFEAYYKAQGMFGIPRAGEIDYTKSLELDLATVKPSLAGPKRPQDRIELGQAEVDVHRRCSASRSPRTASRKPPDKLAQRYLDAADGSGRERDQPTSRSQIAARSRSRATSSRWSTTVRRPIRVAPRRRDRRRRSATATC